MGWYNDGNWGGVPLDKTGHILSQLCWAVNERIRALCGGDVDDPSNPWGAAYADGVARGALFPQTTAAFNTVWNPHPFVKLKIANGEEKAFPVPSDFDGETFDSTNTAINIQRLQQAVRGLGSTNTASLTGILNPTPPSYHYPFIPFQAKFVDSTSLESFVFSSSVEGIYSLSSYRYPTSTPPNQYFGPIMPTQFVPQPLQRYTGLSYLPNFQDAEPYNQTTKTDYFNLNVSPKAMALYYGPLFIRMREVLDKLTAVEYFIYPGDPRALINAEDFPGFNTYYTKQVSNFSLPVNGFPVPNAFDPLSYTWAEAKNLMRLDVVGGSYAGAANFVRWSDERGYVYSWYPSFGKSGCYNSIHIGGPRPETTTLPTQYLSGTLIKGQKHIGVSVNIPSITWMRYNAGLTPPQSPPPPNFNVTLDFFDGDRYVVDALQMYEQDNWPDDQSYATVEYTVEKGSEWPNIGATTDFIVRLKDPTPEDLPWSPFTQYQNSGTPPKWDFFKYGTYYEDGEGGGWGILTAQCHNVAYVDVAPTFTYG
jgi:hypothetical protein